MVIVEPEEPQNKKQGTTLKESIAGAMASLVTESLEAVEGGKDASNENTSTKAKSKPQHSTAQYIS